MSSHCTHSGNESGADLNSSVHSIFDDSRALEIHDCSDQSNLEPIAVVGLSLRFPQDATSADSFWKMLTEGKCAMTEVPQDRWNVASFYHPDGKRNDSIPLRGGHFLKENIAAFDAPFFSISPAEAAALDPQQRLLLETSYRALENAGIPLENVLGSKTSVFTGSFTNDYLHLNTKDTEQGSSYDVIGLSSFAMLANRLSWFYNLSGPSVNLDSACSSSLMALDVACQGLRNGDANMSLIAGCNLMFNPDWMLLLSNMGFLSHDSRCYSFDHRGNGYARGEGIGVVVIKRLSNAIQDGDTIRAIIRSTGSNQDGRTPGITQPSQEAQESLIRETYQKAGLDMSCTRYFEAHGTATPVGDPIEASAIGRAFRRHRDGRNPLYVGAVKSNIGHLEGASAVAGLIKTVLVLERGVIPPNTNFELLNPKIDPEFLKIKFPLENTPWPGNGLRRASINSFGFGGANSHAILDDAYNYLRLHNIAGRHCSVIRPPSPDAITEITSYAKYHAFINDNAQTSTQDVSHTLANGPSHTLAYRLFPAVTNELLTFIEPKVLVWSAADEGGLDRLATVYSSYFAHLSLRSEESKVYLENLAFTLSLRRSSLPWRSFMVANSLGQLQNIKSKLSKPLRATANPRLGFVFTGQGAQWYAMGRELLSFPVFSNSVRNAEMHLHNFGCQWSLTDELLKDNATSNIDRPDFSQLLCTALQIALVDLLRSFEIYPSVVVGHSSGEIAAAYSVGALSSRSACQVAHCRGLLAATLVNSDYGRGAMLAVALSESQVLPYLDQVSLQFGERDLVVACINSPQNTTVSGGERQIDALKVILDRSTIFARKLRVSVAYHSPRMDAIADDYLTLIKDLESGEPAPIPVTHISTVTGTSTSAEELCQGEYWVKNMVSPVRFAEALGQLRFCPAKNVSKKLDGTHRKIIVAHHLLELGPHSALQGPIRDILRTTRESNDVGYSSMLVKNFSAIDTTKEMVGQLHCLGYSVNLSRLNKLDVNSSDCLVALTDLPEYPFDHSQTYWHENRISKGFRFRKSPKLDLLGSPVSDWNPLEARWRNVIKASEMPWIEDHRINSSLLYPAAGILVMAIEAANQVADRNRTVTGFRIKDVSFHTPLNINLSATGVETMFYLRRLIEVSDKESAFLDFRLCVYEEDEWIENCHGTVQIVYQQEHVKVDRGKEANEAKRHYIEIEEAATLSCTQSIDSKQLYQQWQKIGYGYGPSFQTLKLVHCDDKGTATAEVELFRWCPNANTQHPQAHTIHPTTLDGVIQAALAALTRGEDTLCTTVPTYIGELWVSTSGLSHPSNTSVKVVATSESKGHRRVESCISVLHTIDKSLLMQIDRLELTVVSSPQSNSLPDSQPKQISFFLERKPAIALLDRLQILKYCERTQKARIDPFHFFQDLTLLLLMFISKTLESIAMKDLQNLKLHYQKYIEWMRLQLEKFQNGDLPHTQPEWKGKLQDMEYYEILYKRVSAANTQGKLYTTIGQNLIHIIQSEVDPLDLVFKGDLAKDFYQELNDNTHYFSMFGQYLDALAHEDPRMKILEIGAGTGSATVSLLQILTPQGDVRGASRYDRYDFTDISQSFLEKAREAFTNHERMFFKVLNIEDDPVAQGFDAGTYDMIIASNVLHATKNLDVTVRHVRKLLKPGGRLVLLEVTEPQILRSGFIFGVLSGWWLATEEYREWSPCVSTGIWHEILTRQGFSGTDIILRDFPSETCHELSIMVSTAVEQPLEPSNSLRLPRTTILIDESQTIQKSIAQQLEAQLRELGTLDCNICSLHEAALTCDVSQACIFLYELEQPLLHDLSPEAFYTLKRIVTSTNYILWVTRGGGVAPGSPDYGMIDGLARVLRTESDRIAVVTLALELVGTPSEKHINSILKVFRSTAARSDNSDYEPAYVEVDGVLHIDRVIESNHLNQEMLSRTLPRQSKVQKFGGGPPLEIFIESPGLLDTLCWVEDANHKLPLARDEIEIEVKVVGINFMDCLVALGRLNDSGLGSEYAGVVTRVGQDCDFIPGSRVCVANLDCYRSYARSNSQNVARIPDELSFVEAAALPTTFITAYHSLCQVGRIARGESVLIHSGAGGTGQAAIQVAQYFGAEVFTTVGSEKKKELLMNLYAIPNDHIFYSRDMSFAQGVKRMTKNQGVDVILNSLSGEGLVASWECIAPYGRFLEIGKKDISSHQKLPMFPFAKNVTFSAIDIASMERERPWLIHKALEAILVLVAEKRLHTAQPLHVYKISELEQAFRYMQSGQNDGKIVLEVNEEDLVPTLLERKSSFDFNAGKTYVISGGLGGLGRSIARWMVSRGARYLILLSRSGPRSVEAASLLKTLEAEGARVEAPACDVTDASALKSVLERCAKTMPPVLGCVQASMVLKDALFENMSYKDWRAGIEPKVHGSWNLHMLLPKGMDFFILLSSICGIIGQGGQANYAAGNTYEDALAHYRIALGEKAVSIDLGVMGSEGFLAENDVLMHRMLDSGLYLPLTQTELFALLDYYCDPARSLLTTQTCQTVIGIDIPANLRAKGVDEAPWMRKPLFRHMYQVSGNERLSVSKTEEAINVGELFALAGSLSEAGSVVSQMLVKKLSKSLSTLSKSVDIDKPLHSYGVDSLMAIELRTWIGKEFLADVSVFEIMGATSITAIGMSIAGKSRLRQQGEQAKL